MTTTAAVEKKDGTFEKKFLASQTRDALLALKAEHRGNPLKEGSVDLELSKRLASVDAAASEVLHRGTLRYRDAWKQWHAREFVVTLERLAYFKAPVAAADEPEGFMTLAGSTVEVRESKKEGNCFKVTNAKKTHRSGRLNYDNIILACDKAADMNLWLAAIETAIIFASAKALPKPVDSLAGAGAVAAVTSAAHDDSESETQDGTASTADSAAEASSASGKRRKHHKSSSAAAAAVLAAGGAGEDDDAASTASGKQPRKSASKKKELGGLDASGAERAQVAAALVSDDTNSGGNAPAAGPPTHYEPFTPADPNGSSGDGDELGGENKSIVMTLLKQVRPGMDLSKVVLPTFILEPRSMLEKLTDFMSHSDILMKAPTLNDPLERLLAVVKFYVSGFYIKPDGVKKPYNPIIGETFRCMWQYEDGSKTFYVGEQVSHHPPISAFYAQNRQAGVVIDGSILFGSKFMGSYAASTLGGFATVHFAKHNEEYRFSFPDVHAKGFIFGPLMMELVGVMTISCEQTGYKCELEFKSKGMFGGEYNVVSGKVKRGDETLYTIAGKWDESLSITNSDTKQQQVLFAPENHRRVAMFKPAFAEMYDKESDKLWLKVTEAIRARDQKAATDEKYVLESAQRDLHKQLKETGGEWVPLWFAKDQNERWTYKWFADGLKPLESDAYEFESHGRFYAMAKSHSEPNLLAGLDAVDADGSQSDRARRRKHRSTSRLEPAVVAAAISPTGSNALTMSSSSSAASTASAAPRSLAASNATAAAVRFSSSVSPPMSPSGGGGGGVGATVSDSELRQLKSRVDKLETLVTRLQSQAQKQLGSAVASRSLLDNKPLVLALLVLALYIVSGINLLGFLLR